MSISRRKFIRGAGGVTLALPFLELFATRAAWASEGVGPKRLIIVSHQQGTVLNQWVPTGTDRDFTLGPILEPLRSWRDRMLVISGLDNRIPRFNSSGNGHQNADSSLLTCAPFLAQGADPLVAGGPSLDQVIAERIGADSPLLRLDLAIGGGNSGRGTVTSPKHWYGAGDPVVFTSDPVRAFQSLFGGQDSREEQERLRLRRASVLDAVLENFQAFRSRVGVEDRMRLDAHVDKIRQLERRVTSDAALACVPPSLALPDGYDSGFDDDISLPVQVDIAAAAMGCDLTRVVNLWFASGHDPTFPWLDVEGRPVVDTNRYDNWHAMVHDGRDEPGLVAGFTWYAEQFAGLLQTLSERIDTDGDTLLDSSLVMWITEFGNGAGHNTLKIPVILAGNLCGQELGRHLDLMSGGPDANWTPGEFVTGQLYTSILQMFGGEDSSFGLVDDTLPTGGLPGI